MNLGQTTMDITGNQHVLHKRCKVDVRGASGERDCRTRQTRGCRGGLLEGLFELPLDVLNEVRTIVLQSCRNLPSAGKAAIFFFARTHPTCRQILGRLHPMDILRLARTCGSLCRFLTQKSSQHIWRAARRNVKGMPDCPSDMSEYQYVNLAFDLHCHVSAFSRKYLRMI